jgi:hypothetical protein
MQFPSSLGRISRLYSWLKIKISLKRNAFVSFGNTRKHGMFFAPKPAMDRNCQHCGESIVGNAYRVTSEDQGITLLDMIVCSLCFMEAKRLRLHTEEINVRSKQPSARNRGSHSSRLEV